MPGTDLSRGVLLGNRYRLEDPLGQGGMATVYRAHDTMLGRDVAIKLFPAVSEDDEVARHRGEMRILASLSHPGLVTLHDAGSAELGGPFAQTYLVMELVEGPTLADRLARGPVSPAHTARLGRQMAEALSAVHEAGIVHRDLKPGNVLLVGSHDADDTDGPPDAVTTGPVVKLADFGIARLSDGARLTATGITLGTASYLSPEQAVGAAVGPATDVYALGLVLLECLTGRKAFTGTVAEIAVARLSTSPEIPSELGPRWGAVLGAMTQREPEDRPTAAQVALALGEIADHPDPAERAGHASVVVDGVLADRSTAVPEATQPLDILAQVTATSPGRTEAAAMPAAPNPAPGVSPPPAVPPTGGAVRRSRRVGPRVVVGAAAVVLLTSGALLATQLDREPDVGVEPPAYPSVDGPLGTALLDLQRSVEP